MADVATSIIDILKRNVRVPPESMSLDTALSDLDIESLDLAVIAFDIEDEFGIEIPYDTDKDPEDFATVGSIVEKVQSIIAEQRNAA